MRNREDGGVGHVVVRKCCVCVASSGDIHLCIFLTYREHLLLRRHQPSTNSNIIVFC